MRELLADGGPLGSEELAHILSDHGAERVGTADTICMHSEFWNTTATLQWFPRQRRVRVAYAPACGARYVEFGMDDSV
jgi:hypothetical protein